MKAPDKIYTDNRGVYAELPIFSQASANVEYIRKDALLEWTKKKYTEYKQLDEDFQGNVFVGNRQAFAEIIAKIESL